MAPLKTMCDEGSLFKYFSYSYYFSQSFHTFHYLAVKKTYIFRKKELPAGKYMYASPLCVLRQFQIRSV